MRSERCGEPVMMTDSPDDEGKFRVCERPRGHSGRHMTYYCGRRRYWGNEATPICKKEEAKP